MVHFGACFRERWPGCCGPADRSQQIRKVDTARWLTAESGHVREEPGTARACNLMNRSNEFDDTVKQRSGWLIPIAVFVLTAALSALFLLFYLAPTPTSFIEQHPSPTSRNDPVYLSVSGHALTIPANYLLYSSARQGGPRQEIELFATIPDFRGYSDADSQAFAGNGADSPVIYMLIREDRFNIGEAALLQRVYLNYVADPDG